jgi:chemotaxis protein CheZ
LGCVGAFVQRKVFRVEQMLPGRVTAAAANHARPRRAVEDRAAADGMSPLKRELALIQDSIAAHKRELAALLDDGKDRHMARAAGELGAAVEGMEKGTQTILKSAESIDDSAKALAAALKTDYERGLAHDIQDRVVQVYEACNFQDLSGQRIGKVIATLHRVEHELAAMLERCGAAGTPARPQAAANPAT